MSPDTGYVSHQIAGRVRIRIPRRRGDGAFFDKVRDELAKCSGVEAIIVNPLTASLLIRYEYELPQIAEYAEARDLFQLAQLAPSELPVIEKVYERIATLNKAVDRTSGGEVDLAALAFLGLIAISGVQLLRGNFAAPAVTALWYAAEMVARQRMRRTG